MSSTKFVLQTLFKYHTHVLYYFFLIKIGFLTLLDIHELLNQLLFSIFIDHFKLQEIYLYIPSHVLSYKQLVCLGSNTESVTLGFGDAINTVT